MAAQPVEAQVYFQEPVAVIKLIGQIDGFSERALNEAYTEAERWEPDSVLLDLSAGEDINSTGIAMIVNLLSRSRRTQRKLMICGLNPHLQEVFRITRLSDFIDLYAHMAEALAKSVPAPF